MTQESKDAGDKALTAMRRFWPLLAVLLVISIVVVPMIAQSQDKGTAEEVVRELLRPSTTEDIAPQDKVDFALVVNSSRLLYSDATFRTWVARAKNDDVCLIARYEMDTDWAVAATCASPNVVAEAGLPLRLELLGQGRDITLLPDGLAGPAAEATAEGSGGLMPHDNLVVFDLNVRPEVLVLTSADSTTVFDIGSGSSR